MGNSLASVHPVCIGRKITESAGMQKLVREYKANVREYKNCRSKATKVLLNKDIQDIKHKLVPPVQSMHLVAITSKSLLPKKYIGKPWNG